ITRRQRNRSDARSRYFTALIDRCQFDIDQADVVFHVLANHFAFAISGIAHDIETTHFSTNTLQDTGIAHPVGNQRAHPRGALWTVVISTRYADLFGNRFTVVANTRVFHAAARFGVTEEVARVLDGSLQYHAVRVTASAAH